VPVFYYDLGSPECYLMAERIAGGELAIVPEWEPVQLGEPDPEPDRELIERLASEQGLQALRWPERWPPDTRRAMLAATYAKQIGRTVAFSLAAFRQAFAGGRDLSDPDTVLIAGAACEMHPTALLKALEMRSVASALEKANARARAAGIESLPTLT
jgi:2-hydroxychromene-2-carboxylate isomerase